MYMKTYMIALVILGASVVMMGILGIWLIKLGNKTSQHSWSIIGKAVCWAAAAFFIVGVIGLYMASLN